MKTLRIILDFLLQVAALIMPLFGKGKKPPQDPPAENSPDKLPENSPDK